MLPLDMPPGSGQPRLSATADGGLVISWVEPDASADTDAFRLRVATLPSSADAWSGPRTVASGRGWFVNWADVPGVVPVSSSTWAAHWLERSAPSSPYAYDVRVSVSQDAGRTWAPPITPHTDGTRTEHGFVSVFPWPSAGRTGAHGLPSDADVGLVWLDGREMAAAAGGHGEGHGNMTLRAARLGADGTLHDEAVLDARVCECCPTAAIATAEGVVAAYRNRADDETRDIHVVRLEGGVWQRDEVAIADGWTIAACPVNGPALAAEGRAVALAWFTAEGDRPRVQVAVSNDAGRTWRRVAVVDDGQALGRVAVARHPAGGVAVSWVEAEDTGATVRLRHVSDNGTTGPSAVVARVAQSRSSGYPRLAPVGNGWVVAWIEGDRATARVRTAYVAADALSAALPGGR